MKKNVLKRNVVVSAMLTIVLCVSIIAGATYALFTSESKVDVAITSGKVDVVASVDEGSIYTKALKTEYEQGLNHMFGGLVSFKEDGTVTLNNVVPGDAVKFTIVVKNNSSISVKYRTIIVCEENNGLFEALKVTINGTTYDGTTKVTNYEPLAVDSGDQEIIVEIELPAEAGNDYQDKEVTLTYTVEAVQGNADIDVDNDTIYINNAKDLAAALNNYNNGVTVKAQLINDIDMSNWVALDGGTNHANIVLDGNGHVLSNMPSCLFGSLPAKNYEFKNLTFTNVNISDNNYGGGMAVVVGAANANGGGSYTFTNCHIDGGTVAKDATNDTDGRYIGGFIGIVEGNNSGSADITFTNCTVNNVTFRGFKSTGAFIGHTYGNVTMNDCAVKGNTSVTCTENRQNGGAKAGYLIGTVNMRTTAINNCTIASTVTLSNNNAKAPLAGGMIGRNYGTLKLNGGDYIAEGVVLNNGVYEISNVEGFKWFAEKANEEDGTYYTFTGKTAKLVADIDLNNEDWTPIGVNYYGGQFAGTFDGNGHTIKNLKATAPQTDVTGYYGVGLFGWNNGTIKNLIVDGAQITGYGYAGVIAGYMERGTITECTVKNAKIVSKHLDSKCCGDKAGAIVGYINPKNCTITNNTAEDCTVTAARDAGQIVGCGYTNNTITGNKATNVTVTADTTNCNDEDAGKNIKNDIVGRLIVDNN